MAILLALVLIISVLGILGTYIAFGAVYFIEMRKLEKLHDPETSTHPDLVEDEMRSNYSRSILIHF